MKRFFISMLILILIVSVFSACDQQQENPVYSIHENGINEVYVRNAVGRTITIDSQERIKTLIDTLNTATPKITETVTSTLPAEQYRFTLYNDKATVVNTITVYSNELIEIDSKRYSGTFSTLNSLLSSYFVITPKNELLKPVIDQLSDITEINFYNTNSNSYKVIVNSKDIVNVINQINASQDNGTTQLNGPWKECYQMHLRYNDQKEYQTDILFYQVDDVVIIEYEDRVSAVTSLSLEQLYASLPYNELP
ncbi:MAG: hypothetical protein IKT68_05930 [Clostridia bacterium]|nr:hypothetical protein [Clostridia bacterium]